MTKRNKFKSDKPKPTNNNLCFADLKFGMRFQADGEGKRIYKIVGLVWTGRRQEVILKREPDGLRYTYKADTFLALINKSKILDKE